MNLKNRQPKNQCEAILALTLVPQLGAQRIRLLLQQVEYAAEIFTMSHEELKKIEGIGPAIANAVLAFEDWNRVDSVLEQSRKTGARIVDYYSDDYPSLLREIYDAPILLWVKGDTGILAETGIAVVGTRRATGYGLKMAKKFSQKLVARGLTIVSGLAYGVDAAAHKATLQAGGKTIAVLGSGIDVIYPPKHRGLAHEIIEKGGAVISEFPLGTPPEAGNFPERNRIVSGLTLGTLVIESGLKGGSMITAQSALTQNREVFVVPHGLENANGVGCNHLIKRAAGKLVQSTGDIVEELPRYQHKLFEKQAPARPTPRWEKQDLDEASRIICEHLESGAMHIDDLGEELGKASHELLPTLLELEMQQCVRQTAGKNFELV